MDGGTNLRVYDPSQPLSATNPATTNIPAFGTGLALMPNISGGTLCPTFYSTSGGNYYYWDGVNWINTGHSTGSTNAVNLAGCQSYLYNLVGSTGEVYMYNGQNNGTLLTTISGFGSSGPYDLATDCDCNFYAIRTSTTAPGQSLTKYNSSGAVIATYSLLSMPHATAGTGFALVGNTIFLRNNVGNGFYIGTISGNVVNFSSVSGFNASVGDFASCPSCSSAPAPTYSPQVNTAQISCTNPTVNLAVTSSLTPSSYSWTGPGIVGVTTGSVVSVNTAGIYSCNIKYQGCPNVIVTLTSAVTSNTTQVSALIAPSGHVCLSGNNSVKLSVVHTSTNEIVSWIGPGFPSGDTLQVNAPGTFTAKVTDPGNGCEAQDIVHIVASPTLQLSVSASSICGAPYNGSPATLTVIPTGGSSYTLLTGSSFSTSAPFGTVMPLWALNTNLSQATATVIGANGMCSTTSTFSVTIVPNPVVNVPSASVCPGLSHQFNASGAYSYSWAGNGLDTYTGAVVTSTAATTSVYTVTGFESGCYSQDQTTTLTILPLPVIGVTPSFTTICAGTPVALTATGTATSHAWSGASGLVSTSGMQVVATPSLSQVYTVIGSLNGCTGIAHTTVNIVQPPAVSMSLDKNTICFHDYNGSPNTILVMPAGAMQYTLLTGAGFTVAQPNGPVMQVTPVGIQPKTASIFNLQLKAASGVCTIVQTQTFMVLPNPVVLISPSSVSLCPGDEQVFHLNGAATYTWAGSPSLNVLTGSSALVKPAHTSFYSVTGSNMGCHSETKNAVVVVLPAPQITIAPYSTTLCAGSGVVLKAQGLADSYKWEPATDIFPSTGSSVLASPLVPRNYTVIATLNNCTVGAVASLSAIPMPKIFASADDPVICSSSSTMLRASGATSFNWTPADFLNSSTGNQVKATPTGNTTFTVWGFNGTCSGSASVFVETVQRPQIEIKSVHGENSVCYGNSLMVASSGATDYFWSPTAWVHPVSSNTLVSLKPSVSANFTLIGSNHKGSVYCYEQQNYSVTVLSKINPQTSPDVTLCLGEKTTLIASGGTSYKWSPNQGLNITNANRVVAAPHVPTVYSVEVSYHSFCGVTTTLFVNVLPRPDVYAGRDSSYHINDAIHLRATSTGSVQWIGEGILCRSCAETQVLPSRSGCYIAEATNEFGCSASDDVCLEIREDFTFYLPNTFTPNNDGLNDEFMVVGENYSNLSMEIYDRWGKLLFAAQGEGCRWDGMFKGELCKPDIYLYRIQYTGMDRKKYDRTGHITLTR